MSMKIPPPNSFGVDRLKIKLVKVKFWYELINELSRTVDQFDHL